MLRRNERDNAESLWHQHRYLRKMLRRLPLHTAIRQKAGKPDAGILGRGVDEPGKSCIISSRDAAFVAERKSGRMAERSKATDCKSVGVSLR